MNRIALEDGRWFDADKAETWGDDTYWDGNNHISKATGSQWSHEALYLTAGGAWVLNWWSQVQGSRETYTVIEPEEATRWLVRNEHELPEQLRKFEKELEV